MGVVHKFSHTELSAAECSNKHYILYQLKLRNKRYSRMRNRLIGRLTHGGIEILYKLAEADLSLEDLSGGLIDKVLSHVRVLAEKYRGMYIPDEDQKDAEFQRQMDIDFGIPLILVESYYNYHFLREKYETVESELWYDIPVPVPGSGNPSSNKRMRGYIDHLVINQGGDGRLYVHEVKTAASWTDNNDRYLSIDDQTTGYIWGAKQLGYDVAGVIYSVIIKPSLRPHLTDEAKKWGREQRKKGLPADYDPVEHYEDVEQYMARVRQDYEKNPEKYLLRKIFTRTDEQVEAYERRLYYRCDKLIKMKKSKPFPEPSMMKCPTCDAFELCQNFSEDVKNRYYMPKSEDYIDIDEIMSLEE